jgi:hypothetical protein
MSGTLYKGTTFIQDGRFKNKEKRLIEAKNYPKEYEVKIMKERVIYLLNEDRIKSN